MKKKAQYRFNGRTIRRIVKDYTFFFLTKNILHFLNPNTVPKKIICIKHNYNKSNICIDGNIDIDNL